MHEPRRDEPPGGRDGDDLTDDELTALALAADPDQPLDHDAVPISRVVESPEGLPPDWSKPAVRGATRRWLVGAIVLALLVINGAGLCVTYGFPEIAW